MLRCIHRDECSLSRVFPVLEDSPQNSTSRNASVYLRKQHVLSRKWTVMRWYQILTFFNSKPCSKLRILANSATGKHYHNLFPISDSFALLLIINSTSRHVFAYFLFLISNDASGDWYEYWKQLPWHSAPKFTSAAYNLKSRLCGESPTCVKDPALKSQRSKFKEMARTVWRRTLFVSNDFYLVFYFL